MTQEAGDQKPEVKLLPESEMEKMSHSDLYMARSKAKTPEEQKHIAPYEHRAFAREYVEENPVTGSIAMAVAIPGYQAAKLVGAHGSRTGVQGKQVVEGFKGVGEGLSNAVKKPWERVWNNAEKLLESAEGAVAGVVAKKPWERYGKPSSPAPEPSNGDFDGVFSRLMKQESGTRHMDRNGKLITSSAGAEGITQVMPKTGASPGFGVTPIQNKSQEEYIRFGKDYLRAMLKEFDGDYEKALAAYNSGHATVKNAVAKGGASWKAYVPDETKGYVRNIMEKK